jgi:uncharacterized membrane protein
MVKIEQYLRSGWQLFKQEWLNQLAMYAIFFIVWIITQPLAIVPMLLAPPLLGSIVLMTCNRARGVDFDLNDLKLGFKHYWSLVGASLLTAIFFIVALPFFIIPAFLILFFYIYTYPLIVDRQMRAWEAMEESRRTVFKDFFSYMLLGFLLLALMIGGTMLFGVGILLTLPLAVNTLCYAYLDIFGYEKVISVSY